jgi:hypothetical protein
MHAATFEAIAANNRDHRYEEIAARGREAQALAMDITKAMAIVAEMNELRELAADSRYSSELIGIRVRNSRAYT